MSLLALHLLKSHTKAINCILQIVTYIVREKGRRTKVNFNAAMIQVMELLWLANRHDDAMLSSEEIKPVAIAIVHLCLSEGISSLVSQSVCRKLY